MITAYWLPDVLCRQSGLILRRTTHRLLLLTALCVPLAAPAQTQAPTPPVVLSPDGGKQFGPPWLVNLLDRLTPSIDTRLPESSAQVETRLVQQVNAGQYAEALNEIETREAAHPAPGINVQLLFLKARALEGLAHTDQARALYERLTTDYPELPEPWNNLAVLQAAAGELEAAQQSLNLALRLAPDFQTARNNLKDVAMMLAAQAPANAAAPSLP